MYIVAAGLIILARQPDWTLGWIYVGLFVTGNGICAMSLFLWNTELAWRRAFSDLSGTKRWDLIWFTGFLACLFALFLVAVRDFNLPAGDLISPGIEWLTGLVSYFAGWALFTWSGVSNPFFEKTVRIQTEVDHRVIDKGPYLIVRHPGYVGFIVTLLATPLLLPSAWIVVLSLILVQMLVIRTALEDRALHAELPGYAEYATRVRCRLIPGVW